MTTGDEIGALTNELLSLRQAIKPSDDRAWRRPAALRVIDCVLSLRRKYDGFVVPRLDQFEKNSPHVRAITELRDAMDSATSASDYVERTLNYRDTNRARTLFEVVTWFSGVAGMGDYDSQLAKLQQWAQSAQPDGYKALHIRGFGPAGWQYLRMLFGANTTKPDVHIVRFVEKVTGRKFTPEQALHALEQASERADVFLRDLDTTIWESSARPAKC